MMCALRKLHAHFPTMHVTNVGVHMVLTRETSDELPKIVSSAWEYLCLRGCLQEPG